MEHPSFLMCLLNRLSSPLPTKFFRNIFLYFRFDTKSPHLSQKLQFVLLASGLAIQLLSVVQNLVAHTALVLIKTFKCPNSPPTCANWKGEHLSTDPKCPELQLLKDVQLLAADENIPLKEAREILTATHPSRSSTLNIMDFPPISSSLETPSGFTFDSPSPPSPLSSPPLRRVTFAQAVQNNPHTQILRTKTYATNHPLLPSQLTSRNDHDYLLEPNGRPSIKPPDGCAYPSRGNELLNSLPSPAGPIENQLGAVLHLLIQIINMFSTNMSSFLPKNYF